MPLYNHAITAILKNLSELQSGGKPSMIEIGSFSDEQFKEINVQRIKAGLFQLESNEIVFIGRHLYNSRSQDSYTIDDMIDQIVSALHTDSVVELNQNMSCLQNKHPRADSYENFVYDRAVFEMARRKPRAELYSVIPKNDRNKPRK